MPIEAPAPVVKKEATTKTVIAVSGTMPETTVGTAPTTTASSSTTAKELTLDEKIEGISVDTTASQANEIVSALLVPTNDPDGKLTQKALAKAEAVANQILSGNDDSLKADLFAYATQIAQKPLTVHTVWTRWSFTKESLPTFRTRTGTPSIRPSSTHKRTNALSPSIRTIRTASTPTSAHTRKGDTSRNLPQC